MLLGSRLIAEVHCSHVVLITELALKELHSMQHHCTMRRVMPVLWLPVEAAVQELGSRLAACVVAASEVALQVLGCRTGCDGLQGCACVAAASEVALKRSWCATVCILCRVVRGLLLAVGRPDGRLCSHAKTEAWVVLGLQQVGLLY